MEFNHVVDKEMILEKGDQWNNLLLNVGTHRCRESFGKLFRYFYPHLVGHGMKSGLSREMAGDLAQEAMVRVWNHAKSFDASKGKASLWIYVVARNLKYDYLRKLRNDPIHASSQDIYPDEVENLNDKSNLDAIFDLGILKQQLSKLSPEQQDVINRLYFDGMTQQEMAEESGIPLGTIKSRVRLAISSIKKSMEEKSK